MGCEVEAECSPQVQRKVVSAATRNRSYEEASADLEDLAELEISAKQCERIAQRIGNERLQERQQRCEAFEQLPLLQQKQGQPTDAPANDWKGRVAAVIVDLMQAIAYVCTAALESSPDMPDCWQRDSRWITWIWQGQVTQMLPELQALATTAADPRSQEVLTECLTYLTNNAPRMRYDQYRRAGLPLTTVLAESGMKQINRRMKGTEKFWRPGSEPQLQLCCDQLSETRPLDTFWQRRAARQSGFRKSRSTTMQTLS